MGSTDSGCGKLSNDTSLLPSWLSQAVGVQWVLCFLTQHNSHLRLVEKALSYIEEVSFLAPALYPEFELVRDHHEMLCMKAISHTPTIVELYLVKARAQKVRCKTWLRPCQLVFI